MINKSSDVLEHLGLEYGKTARVPFESFASDDNTAMPAELRNWLVRLRLLEGVPFANLVADSALLPEESIRWFYLDRRWTDALVQGALSVGTVNSDDRVQLDAQYAAIRAELDTEERNVRRLKGMARLAGQPGPVSGFLLRSSAVSGWPGLHVRAFNEELTEADHREPMLEDDPRRVRLLRLERLAPAVLLCLFDGIPREVHIEEPRQGVQFGFMHEDNGSQRSASLRPRDKDSFEYLADDGSKDVKVPFRVGSSGVVDIRRLSDALAAYPETGAGDGLDGAEYALQLIRFPWRQVFGKVQGPELNTMFRVTIDYESMVTATFRV